MNRSYPERPMVGVGAIIFRKDSVLLVKRGRQPAYGEWSLPGGLVEVGESLEEAVRREVREEVGLHVTVKDLAVALDRVILDEAGKIEYHYVLLDFICECSDGEPMPASDALACAFISLDDLSRYSMTRGTEQVIRRTHAKTRSALHVVYDPSL
jgi:8-oxo-dGTP diphosphatase